MTTMRDANLPLIERINLAIERIRQGHASMRVPVEATDPDVVLSDCRAEIEKLRKDAERLSRQHKQGLQNLGPRTWRVTR